MPNRKIARYGWKKDSPDPRDHHWMAPSWQVMRRLAPRYDWRSLMPPIEDQDGVGCCTGESVTGQIWARGLMDGITGFLKPSVLFTYYQGRKIEGAEGSDAGAMIRDVVKGAATVGWSADKVWPFRPSFTTKNPSAEAYQFADEHKIHTYQRVPQSVGAFKARLAEKGLISGGFSVPESFESPAIAKDGIMRLMGHNEGFVGGHAVLLVGMDDTLHFPSINPNTIGYGIWRNSWSVAWGLKGYFMVPYSMMFDSDLFSDFWSIFMTPGVV